MECEEQQQHVIDPSLSTMVKNEPEDESLDDWFVMELKKLIHVYMQHTTRPFPMKYFLDLTDHSRSH